MYMFVTIHFNTCYCKMTCTYVCTIFTDFMISSSILFERKRHRVGQEQAINCTATLISTAEHSVIFNWVTPDGVNIDDERITILPTTINENNHTSVLQFEYQMESDNGTYKCEIMSNNTTTSASRELQDLYGK